MINDSINFAYSPPQKNSTGCNVFVSLEILYNIQLVLKYFWSHKSLTMCRYINSTLKLVNSEAKNSLLFFWNLTKAFDTRAWYEMKWKKIFLIPYWQFSFISIPY